MTTQPDLLRDSPEAQAELYRIAADTARNDYHYPEAERLKRAAYYEQKAESLSPARP